MLKTLKGLLSHSQIGGINPEPQPTVEQLNEQKKQKENDEIRAQVQNIIKDELRKNPDQYKNKNANDLSQEFRNLLIEKLAKINQTIEKPKEITTQSHPKKWNFLLNRNKSADNYNYGDFLNENENEYEDENEI